MLSFYVALLRFFMKWHLFKFQFNSMNLFLLFIEKPRKNCESFFLALTAAETPAMGKYLLIC